MSSVQKTFEFILDLIFPKTCLGCGKFDSWLCGQCLEKIVPRPLQRCVVCNKPAINGQTHPKCYGRNCLNGLLAMYYFEQLQDIIHAYKYSLVRDLADPLAELYWRYISDNRLTEFFSDFSLTAVPLHKARLRFRGFNQSELIAERLAKRLDAPALIKSLERTKNTAPQTTLDKSERLQNLTGTIANAAVYDIRDKNILLIDDVATTGATLNECARALKSSGAARVWAIVLARA